jgi:uncharacterized protein (TIGR03086 family)
MVTENLAKAFASTRTILSNVTADDLDKPTPCKSWAVRDVINHVVGGAHWFGLSTEAGDAPEIPTTDYTQGDMVASFDEGVARTIAAFEAPGAQEKIVKLPFGEFPGAVFMGLATSDTFTHGWDLAKATGQSTDLEPALAAEILQAASMLVPDAVRGEEPMPFAPVKDAPAGATAADQLAAFMGRTV